MFLLKFYLCFDQIVRHSGVSFHLYPSKSGGAGPEGAEAGTFLSGQTCPDELFSGHLCPDKLRTFKFGI